VAVTSGTGATSSSTPETGGFPWRTALTAAAAAALLAVLAAGAAALEPQYELRLSGARAERTRTAPSAVFAGALIPRLWWPLPAWTAVWLVRRRPLLSGRPGATIGVHGLAAGAYGSLQGASAVAAFALSHGALIMPAETLARIALKAAPGGVLAYLLAALGAAVWLETRKPAGAAAFDQQPASPPGEPLDHLLARAGRRLTRIPVSQIDWIGASGPYCEVRAAGRTHLIRASLGDIESRLDPASFIRIHRSTLVRLDRIGELKQRARGDYAVVLQDGVELNVSRARRRTLTQRLGPSL
jgi:DNA-binding LytR/AlgR family response regulator